MKRWKANTAFWRLNLASPVAFAVWISVPAQWQPSLLGDPGLASSRIDPRVGRRGLLRVGARTCWSGCPPRAAGWGLCGSACRGLGLASSSRKPQPRRRGEEQMCPGVPAGNRSHTSTEWVSYSCFAFLLPLLEACLCSCCSSFFFLVFCFVCFLPFLSLLWEFCGLR